MSHNSDPRGPWKLKPVVECGVDLNSIITAYQFVPLQLNILYTGQQSRSYRSYDSCSIGITSGVILGWKRSVYIVPMYLVVSVVGEIKTLPRSECNIQQNSNSLNTPMFKLLAQDFASAWARGNGYVVFSPPVSASVLIADKPSMSWSLVSSHRSITTSAINNHVRANCNANGSEREIL